MKYILAAVACGEIDMKDEIAVQMDIYAELKRIYRDRSAGYTVYSESAV